MAIGVQTDCATPALANFGSDKLKRNYLTPALRGDMVTSIAVSAVVVVVVAVMVVEYILA